MMEKGEYDQLAHDRDNDKLRRLTLGFESIGEGLENGIVPDRNTGRHVQRAS